MAAKFLVDKQVGGFTIRVWQIADKAKPYKVSIGTSYRSLRVAEEVACANVDDLTSTAVRIACDMARDGNLQRPRRSDISDAILLGMREVRNGSGQ